MTGTLIRDLGRVADAVSVARGAGEEADEWVAAPTDLPVKVLAVLDLVQLHVVAGIDASGAARTDGGPPRGTWSPR